MAQTLTVTIPNWISEYIEDHREKNRSEFVSELLAKAILNKKEGDINGNSSI